MHSGDWIKQADGIQVVEGVNRMYYSKYVILSETGFGSEGGICDVASLAKGKYYAKLTGVADEIGGFGFYEVSPNAVISFTR